MYTIVGIIRIANVLKLICESSDKTQRVVTTKFDATQKRLKIGDHVDKIQITQIGFDGARI